MEAAGFQRRFTSSVRALVEKKAKAGDRATVEPFEDAADVSASNVVDLGELLRQSLGGKGKSGKNETAQAPAVKASAKKAAPARRSPTTPSREKKAA